MNLRYVTSMITAFKSFFTHGRKNGKITEATPTRTISCFIKSVNPYTGIDDSHMEYREI